MNHIEFDRVSFSYKSPEGEEIKVLEDFSLTIQTGELVYITGRSGVGKTTLIRLLLGDIVPDKGKIIVDNKDISQIEQNRLPYYRRTLGVVFQDYSLIDDISVYDNVKLAMQAAGSREKNILMKVYNILAMLGIDNLHKRLPTELSGGECQKVCMARAIINHPRLLLCDEPTGNLSPGDSQEIFRLLEIINDRGITVIVATHDLPQVRVQMDKGYSNCRMIDMNQYEGIIRE